MGLVNFQKEKQTLSINHCVANIMVGTIEEKFKVMWEHERKDHLGPGLEGSRKSSLKKGHLNWRRKQNILGTEKSI